MFMIQIINIIIVIKISETDQLEDHDRMEVAQKPNKTQQMAKNLQRKQKW